MYINKSMYLIYREFSEISKGQPPIKKCMKNMYPQRKTMYKQIIEELLVASIIKKKIQLQY